MSHHPHLELLGKFLRLRPYSRYNTVEVIRAARLLIPYALGKAGEGKFVILNRNYKPLGIEDQLGGYVNYEELPEFLKISAYQAAALGLPEDWGKEWPGYLGTARRALSAVDLVRKTMEVLKNGQ